MDQHGAQDMWTHDGGDLIGAAATVARSRRPGALISVEAEWPNLGSRVLRALCHDEDLARGMPRDDWREPQRYPTVELLPLDTPATP